MKTNEVRELLPCPFCGGKANIERIGTPRQSCLVACSNCGTFLETGEQGMECGSAWNSRAVMLPEGWKLIPIEPTPSMILNGWLIGLNPKEAYADMLASAPQPDFIAQLNFTAPVVKTPMTTDPTDTEILDWLDRVSHKKANDWWVENFGTNYNHQSLREAIINAMRNK